jgi:hypothetical protein
MRRVLGVASVIVVLCSAGLVQAQEGWGTPPPDNSTTGSGETGGWGQTPTNTPPPSGEQGGGWNTPTNPQANDTENPTGQGTTGWGQPQATPPQQPPTTQPATTTTTTTPEETELVGDAFRLAHRVYLGGHTHMSGAFLSAYDGVPAAANDAMSPWLNFSFMYTISRLLTIDIFMGFTVGNHGYTGNGDDSVTGHTVDGDSVTNFEFGLGPRLLFTLHSGDRTRLYTGAGLAMIIGYHNASRDDEDEGVCPGGCGGWDAYGFALAAPIGFEYRFRNAPNLAISMELNFHFLFQNVGMRYEDPEDPPLIVSQSEFNQITLGIGNPRQPGAIEFADILTFLTFGLHYML